MTGFYAFSLFVLKIFFALAGRLNVSGKENFPLSGGVILAGNHKSYLDPPLLGTASPRQVYFMAKEELFKIPVLKQVITWQGAFPVCRGKADRRAVKKALELLAQGKVVGIFPEGSRSKPGELKEGELGAALLAYKAKLPVLPVALQGTQKFPFSNLQVKFGKLIYPQETQKVSRACLAEFTAKIMQSLSELCGEELKA